MNEYVRECRTHWAAGAKMKGGSQEAVEACIRAARLKPFKGKVGITYRFYEMPNRGKLRDKSNIASFAIKVIEDALQNTGIIVNDDWRYLSWYRCEFSKVDENPCIEVTVEDA